MALEPISASLTVTGRVEAIDRVEVRARIEGFLEEVAFTEGAHVKEGDLLYRIERGLFEAAVQEAAGALDEAHAARDLAELQLTRAEELLIKQAGTEVRRDEARAALGRATGGVKIAQANLATAEINLGYTEIKAPVAGRIGMTALTKGAVVNPSSGVLATIVSQDPMYVTFPVSARELLRDKPDEERDPDSIKVSIRFLDGAVYPHTGRLDFVDVSVNQQTDTVQGRSTLANPENVLIDGQLVTVRLEAGTPVEKPVIPQSALIADQGGVYVFTVEDGKATIRRVRTGGVIGANIIVEEGLSANEMVVTEGIERLRAGVAVTASPAAPQGTN